MTDLLQVGVRRQVVRGVRHEALSTLEEERRQEGDVVVDEGDEGGGDRVGSVTVWHVDSLTYRSEV